MTQDEKDTYYMNIAKVVATRSTCFFGNVGCVVVDKNDDVLSIGYLADKDDIINCRKSGYCSFAEREGVTDCFGTPECCDYMFPEVQAVLAADRTRLKDSTLYLWLEDIKTGKPTKPKLEKTVSKIILAAGIKRIVIPQT